MASAESAAAACRHVVTKDDVVEWFACSNDDEVTSVLVLVAEKRPWLFAMATGIANHGRVSDVPADGNENMVCVDRGSRDDGVNDNHTSIQFGGHMFFAEEDD